MSVLRPRLECGRQRCLQHCGCGCVGIHRLNQPNVSATALPVVVDFREPFYSSLADKGTHSQWVQRGATTMEARAAKQVDKILKKLGKKWDKILAGKGK